LEFVATAETVAQGKLLELCRQLLLVGTGSTFPWQAAGQQGYFHPACYFQNIKHNGMRFESRVT
jgi:hypothetical protein